MKQLKILNIKLLRIRSTKKKGGFSLPLPPISKNYSILFANQNIFLNKKNKIGFVTIKREKEKNSLDIETSKEIYNGLKELETDKKVRCLVIQGNEKLFSPGADINELNTLDSETAKSRQLFVYFDKIEQIKIPIIALV